MSMKETSAAYAEAVRRLKGLHEEEFQGILRGVYEERGLTIRVRMTSKQKLEAELDKARQLLAEHGEI